MYIFCRVLKQNIFSINILKRRQLPQLLWVKNVHKSTLLGDTMCLWVSFCELKYASAFLGAKTDAILSSQVLKKCLSVLFGPKRCAKMLSWEPNMLECLLQSQTLANVPRFLLKNLHWSHSACLSVLLVGEPHLPVLSADKKHDNMITALRGSKTRQLAPPLERKCTKVSVLEYLLGAKTCAIQSTFLFVPVLQMSAHATALACLSKQMYLSWCENVLHEQSEFKTKVQDAV